MTPDSATMPPPSLLRTIKVFFFQNTINMRVMSVDSWIAKFLIFEKFNISTYANELAYFCIILFIHYFFHLLCSKTFSSRRREIWSKKATFGHKMFFFFNSYNTIFLIDERNISWIFELNILKNSGGDIFLVKLKFLRF